MSGFTAVVYGGSGALGRVLVTAFRKANWAVTSVDFRANDEASANIILSPGDGFDAQYQKVVAGFSTKVDAIFNVAGGWAGGNLTDDKLLANVDLMFTQSAHSSIITTKLATKFLKEGGLITLVGAAAAINPTPSMIAYGMAKAAVHHLVKSAAEPDSGLPKGSTITAILPVILDTPGNRSWATPETDTSTWTPMSEIANKFLAWATKKETPQNGSLIKVETKDNKTSFVTL